MMKNHDRRGLRWPIALGIGSLTVLAALAGAPQAASASNQPVLTAPQGSFSLSQIAQMSTAELEASLASATGTDGQLSVNKAELLKALAKDGQIRLPVAASAKLVSSRTAAPMYNPDDASITYRRPLPTGPATITICQNWAALAADGCLHLSGDGTLSDRQNSNTKYGWPDAGGYYNKRNCSSQATDRSRTASTQRAGSSCPRPSSRATGR